MRDDLRQYDVTLTDVVTGEVVRSHTWAKDVESAHLRMQEQMAENPDAWDGWDFKVLPRKEDFAELSEEPLEEPLEGPLETWWALGACLVFGALFGAFVLAPVARSMGWL